MKAHPIRSGTLLAVALLVSMMASLLAQELNPVVPSNPPSRVQEKPGLFVKLFRKAEPVDNDEDDDADDDDGARRRHAPAPRSSSPAEGTAIITILPAGRISPTAPQPSDTIVRRFSVPESSRLGVPPDPQLPPASAQSPPHRSPAKPPVARKIRSSREAAEAPARAPSNPKPPAASREDALFGAPTSSPDSRDVYPPREKETSRVVVAPSVQSELSALTQTPQISPRLTPPPSLTIPAARGTVPSRIVVEPAPRQDTWAARQSPPSKRPRSGDPLRGTPVLNPPLRVDQAPITSEPPAPFLPPSGSPPAPSPPTSPPHTPPAADTASVALPPPLDSPTPPAELQQGAPRSDVPFGMPVPGRPGIVYPPGVKHTPENMIDVTDIPPGTKVRDPYTKTVFRVPSKP